MIEAIYLEEEVFVEMGIGMPELEMTPPLNMSGLTKIVVLAGPNGGGKSRILRMLPKLLTKKLTPAQLEDLEGRDEAASISLLDREESLQRIPPDEYLEPNPELEYLRSQIAGLEQECRVLALQRRMSESVTTTDGLRPKFVSFVPSGYQLHDPFQLTQNDAAVHAARLSTTITSSQGDAPAYAAHILRMATEQGYQRFQAGQPGLSAAEKEKDRLLQILGTLLGHETQVALHEGRLRVGGYDPYWQMLSAGQQMLFQFGCLLHAQASQVRDAIVLMDEPENHLHPGVLIQVIDSLMDLLSDGQLWIATHSVPLIAHLMRKDSECLWYVNEGRVKRSGRTPEVVLESLLGGEQGAVDLQALTLLPSAYAASRFLSECLRPPGVVGADVKDPQTLQIREALWSHLQARDESKGRLRILDFGAGKGRVLATLMDSVAGDDEPWFDYFAYDACSDDRAECEMQIEAAYGSSRDRWFCDLHTLGARLNQGSFDVVVMCNVLHEVPPSDWLPTAEHCVSLLRPSGNLVVVEDYGIPVGERAHEYGFLLLDEPELSVLFSVGEEDRRAGRFCRATSTEARYKDRLVAHLVNRECVKRLTTVTRAEAIGKLHLRTMEEVRTWLRNPSSNSQHGRSYARSTQLLANAAIWLNANT